MRPLALLLALAAGCSPPPATPIVRILTLKLEPPEAAEGSGVVVAPALVVTSGHVVSGRTLLGVQLPDGRRVAAEVVAEDAGHDLAVVRVEGRSFASVRVSDRVPVPGSRGWAVTKFGVTPVGIVGTADDDEVGPVVLFDADLGEGASCGALLDDRGELIGVIRGLAGEHAEAVGVAAVRNLLSQCPSHAPGTHGRTSTTSPRTAAQ